MRKILFITFDQWRADAMSLRHHPVVATPNVDALAAEAVSFERHYTSSTPCGPSRATILTGLYPFNHRSVRNGAPLDRRHSNLAWETRRAGVRPYLIGYTDTSLDPRGRPAGDPDLRVYESVMEGFELLMRMAGAAVPMTEWTAHLGKKGYTLPEKQADLIQGVDTLPPGEEFRARPAFYRAEDSDTAFLADTLIDHIRYNRADEWLIHASFLRPHPPLFAPAPYCEMVNPGDVPAPVRAATLAEEAAAHPFMDYWLNVVQGSDDYFQKNFRANQRSLDEIKAIRAVYYGLVMECDYHLGRIVAALKESGQYDETLIVLTSDHGEMLGDHWMWGKGGYFDASNHVPLIIRDPRQAAQGGRRVRAFTESVDVAPTIIDWLGGEIPHAWDGRALTPWLSGEDGAEWRDAAFWEYDFRDAVSQTTEAHLGLTSAHCVMNARREAGRKYVHFNGLPPLLFDLTSDPGEMRNLALGAAEQVAECAGALLSHRMTHAERTLADTLLTPDGPVSHIGPR